jgi:hypothetical protein
MKLTVEDEINGLLHMFRKEDLSCLLTDVLPLLELYNVADDNDWLRDAVGEDDSKNVRLIRTVYLLSWFAERNVSKLASIKVHFKGLWKRIEKQGALNE